MDTEKSKQEGTIAELMKQKFTPTDFADAVSTELKKETFPYKLETEAFVEDKEITRKFLELSLAWVWKMSVEAKEFHSYDSQIGHAYSICSYIASHTSLLTAAGKMNPAFVSTALEYARALTRSGTETKQKSSKLVFNFLVAYADQNKTVRDAVEKINGTMRHDWWNRPVA